MGNHEPEEVQVNNDLGGNQLGDLQYKLIQRNGKFSSDRCQGIIGREMPGMRKGTPKGGLITVMGIPRGKLKYGALGENGTFIRVLRNDVPKDGVCINGMSVYTIKHNTLKAGRAKTDA